MLRSLCDGAVRVLPLLLIVNACHVERVDGGPVALPFDVWEQEPNDSHCCANDVGWVSVGDSFVIGGSIRDDGLDPFDGFRLRNVGPCSIRFALEPLDGVSDLDLCVWDPLLGSFSFCFESANPVEHGVFNVPFGGEDFHLVVASYVGHSEYRLHVRCEPIGFGLVAGDAPGAAGNRLKAGHFAPYGAAPSAAPAPRRSAGPLWVLDYDADFEHIELHEGLWIAGATSAPRDRAQSEE